MQKTKEKKGHACTKKKKKKIYGQKQLIQLTVA
jgi:hypothetical protein